MDQALEGSPWYLATIEWLKTLPLFFENEAFRCVHAAWDEHHINTLRPFCNDKGVLKPEIWDQLEHMDRSFFKALDYCLNGSKLQLPDGHSFTDSGGRQRYKARLKWWDITHPATFKNACTSVPNLEQLPNEAVDISLLPSIDGDTPIFFGHYWMQGKPHLMSTKFACLDWSVVLDDGVLAAYRFDGEQELEEHKLTWV